MQHWLAPFLATAVASCALLTATPPQVEVQDVRLRGVGLVDQLLDVQLCVTNPNDTAFGFRRVTVALEAEGEPLAEGATETAVRLPPRSSTLVPFEVVTTIRNLGPQLVGVVASGGIDYRVHGTVHLKGALALALPFSRSGHLGLLTAGQGVIADAAAPAGTRCGSTAP